MSEPTPTWRDGNPWGNRVPEYGTRCRTKSVLGDTRGFLVHPKHMEARKTGALGMIEGWVPGHGGEVCIVRHAEGPGDADPSPIAVYGFWELEKIDE